MDYTIEFTILDLIPLPQDVEGGERQTLDRIISYCTYNNIPDIVNSKVHDVGYRMHSGSYDQEDFEEVVKSETFVSINFQHEEIDNADDYLTPLYVAAVKSLSSPNAHVVGSYSEGDSPRQRNVIIIQS